MFYPSKMRKIANHKKGNGIMGVMFVLGFMAGVGSSLGTMVLIFNFLENRDGKQHDEI